MKNMLIKIKNVTEHINNGIIQKKELVQKRLFENSLLKEKRIKRNKESIGNIGKILKEQMFWLLESKEQLENAKHVGRLLKEIREYLPNLEKDTDIQAQESERPAVKFNSIMCTP